MDGMVAPMVFDGPIDGYGFAAPFIQIPATEPRPDDIVVIDNLSSHKRATERERIMMADAASRFFPPGSPDFSPAAKAYFEFKVILRNAREQKVSALWFPVKSISKLDTGTAQDTDDSIQAPESQHRPPGCLPHPH